MTDSLRILAAGDSYITAEALESGLRARIDPLHEIEAFQVDESFAGPLAGLREFAGDPVQLAERARGIGRAGDPRRRSDPRRARDSGPEAGVLRARRAR